MTRSVGCPIGSSALKMVSILLSDRFMLVKNLRNLMASALVSGLLLI
jgi:hypothetical protein